MPKVTQEGGGQAGLPHCLFTGKALLGILGNAFALRYLAKISSSDFPSGFPSWAE